MSRINICFSCDDNYSKYAGVAIASILQNANDDDNLNIYILDDDIKEENKNKILSLKSVKDCKISFIKIDKTEFLDYANIKTHSYITLPTYYRLKLASILPDVDKIIYFDCDMVINSSLAELFNTNLDDWLMGAVLEGSNCTQRFLPNHINAGMILYNLKNIRKDRTEDKFLTWTRQHADEIFVGDQTIINEVCKGKIKILDPNWNVQTFNFSNRSHYTNNPKVIHYITDQKPWIWGSYNYYKEYYFKYLQLTPWKLSKKEYFRWTVINELYSLIKFVKYRPLFFLRRRYFIAFYKTYIVPEKN